MYIMNSGLEAIVGPMFSEKSGKLITALELAEKYEGKKVIAFKPVIENRFGVDIIASRLGMSIKATNVPLQITDDVMTHILDISKDYDVIGFDEVQFFNGKIVMLLQKLLKMKKRIIVSGLDRNYLGEPFGKIGEILAIATERISVQPPVCSCCKKRYAAYSQKYINGKLDISRKKIVQVENKKYKITYEPRCIDCFVYPEDEEE